MPVWTSSVSTHVEEKIDEVLRSLGWVRSKMEHGLYINGEDADRMFRAMYVDDLFLVGKSELALAGEKKSLRGFFKMKDLGEAKYVLGVEIRRSTGGGVLLVQEKYARAIVAKFHMEDAKFSALPFDPAVKLSVKKVPLI